MVFDWFSRSVPVYRRVAVDIPPLLKRSIFFDLDEAYGQTSGGM